MQEHEYQEVGSQEPLLVVLSLSIATLEIFPPSRRMKSLVTNPSNLLFVKIIIVLIIIINMVWPKIFYFE